MHAWLAKNKKLKLTIMLYFESIKYISICSNKALAFLPEQCIFSASMLSVLMRLVISTKFTG